MELPLTLQNSRTSAADDIQKQIFVSFFREIRLVFDLTDYRIPFKPVLVGRIQP